jgi:Putative DNA-binding domain
MLGSEFLDLALSGETVAAEKIRELVRTRTEEDQWIDFKSGRLLSEKDAGAARVGKPIDPAAKLRRYVSSFANAEGGALVVGVVDKDDRADHFDGCTHIGNETPKVWAQRALAPLAYHLTTPMRFHELDVDACKVLIVAVGRSDRLVPCSELGQLVHYMRIGEQSPAVPEYLVKDVLLGRRQRPEISLTVDTGSKPNEQPNELILRVRIRNEGLQLIPSYVVVVARCREGAADPKIGPGLRRFVEVLPSSLAVVSAGAVVIRPGKSLAPFAESEPHVFDIQLIRAGERFAPSTVRATLLVVPEGDLPHLIQITAHVERGRTEWRYEPLPPGAKGLVGVEC